MKTFTQFVAVLTLAWTGSAASGPLLGSNGEKVTPEGVWGIEYDGVLYDIDIGDQGGKTASQVYADYGLPNDPLENPVYVGVNTLMIALFNTLAIAPTYFDGCEDPTFCSIISPTYTQSNLVFGYNNTPAWVSSSPWIADMGTLPGIFPVDIIPGSTFAIIRESAVSLPSSLALFALGILGLTRVRRRA